ncbi:hypothetical protein [Vibrio phage JSF12]|uniref:Uncharacterized protein n=3 Tax=Jesfedecavirus TaxID=2560156 RepID=A0A2D0YX99_9CAUD|nr:hypothetical protein AVV29_gp130 [Vibrio phage phi 3]YP_009618441.1 hypothetical protein FDI98_gp118 [Vibrio phage JSF10]YP_009794698.1 hypothetical protein HOS35_gp015 [Vibrio phage JSF12]AJF40848.1 hypothetical protein SBVP3_0081 [Vibrio phage phi 3]ASV43414.1 hypothetical protein [Vibrio phage JSF10]ASV43533.1 hypothetical protein [Vibrio phage JSF12]
MNKNTVVSKPVAGDVLLIGKVLRGLNRAGKPVFSTSAKGFEPKTTIEAVYEDGRVRSKEGDVFEIRLLKPELEIKTKEGTKLLPAQWITVA